MKNDAEKIADELLMMRLLSGFHVENGIEVTRYLKHNSHGERLARVALAREVRASMWGFVGELLALAIDPRTPSSWPGMRPTRRIKFESPTRGKGSTWARDLAVISLIRERLRDDPKLEAALSAASERYGIKRNRVHAIWKKHEKDLENTLLTRAEAVGLGTAASTK